MKCQLAGIVLLLALAACARAWGAWIAYEDGNGYSMFCDVDGNESFKIRESRVVDGDCVEQSAFAIVDQKPNPLRDMAQSYVNRFQSLHHPSNAVGCATNQVDCVLGKRAVSDYDLGCGRGRLRLDEPEARQLESESMKLVDSCRRAVETAPYNPCVVYYRKRYKRNVRTLIANYDDVIGSARLYSGFRIGFQAAVSNEGDEPELKKTDKRLQDDAFISVYGKWASLVGERANGCQVNTELVSFVQGRADVGPGGNLTLLDWEVCETMRANVDWGVEPDVDRSLSMEYYSPCRDFRLILRDEKRTRYVTYCCGVVSVIEQKGLLPCVSVGMPYDALAQVYFDLSGHVEDEHLLIKQNLSRLASTLGVGLRSPLCKARRWSSIEPFIKESKDNMELVRMVDELILSLWKQM